MTAPATSARETALANLATVLGAVTKGASYNFTVDAVARVDGPLYAYGAFWKGYDTVALIEEGLTSWTPMTQQGVWLCVQEVFVHLVTRYEPDEPDPFKSATNPKSTLRSKLMADALKAVMANHTLSNSVKRGSFLTDAAPVNLDDISDAGTWIGAGWVALEMRFELNIEVDEATP